jgi:hypothetical protein
MGMGAVLNMPWMRGRGEGDLFVTFFMLAHPFQKPAETGEEAIRWSLHWCCSAWQRWEA